MPFAAFLNRFPADPGSSAATEKLSAEDIPVLLDPVPASFVDFLRTADRSSHSSGLVRFLLPAGKPSLLDWNDRQGWIADWPDATDRLVVFAYSWMGWQLAFDRSRMRGVEPLVAILEPGTGEVLEVPQTFAEFVDGDLVHNADAVLAADLFDAWRQSGGPAPSPAECVGYRVPLFLGGEDQLSNLELTNLEVYLSITGQLWRAAKSLPPGTSISEVRLE